MSHSIFVLRALVFSVEEASQRARHLVFTVVDGIQVGYLMWRNSVDVRHDVKRWWWIVNSWVQR
jgi:hypothetical protein